MTIRPLMLALLALVVLAASAPAEARHYGHGVRHHHRAHHWHGGYARATSDYYHRSRMLVGTR